MNGSSHFPAGPQAWLKEEIRYQLLTTLQNYSVGWLPKIMLDNNMNVSVLHGFGRFTIFLIVLIFTMSCSRVDLSPIPTQSSTTPIHTMQITQSDTATMLPPTSTISLATPTIDTPTPTHTLEPMLVFTPLPSQISPSGGVSFVDSGQRLGDMPSECVDLGDLDGDGDLDAIVANRRHFQVWVNDGNAVFAEGQQLTKNISGLKLGDLDQDGDLDVFTVDTESNAAIWFNDAAGSFTSVQRITEEANGNSVALGDVDLDGDLDAFIARNELNTVWLNDGQGKFVDSGQRLGTNHLVNDFSIDAILADLDGDRDLDVFEVIYGGLHRVWFNDGEGNFTDSGQEINVGSEHSHGVALGDLDLDGDLDAFVTITSLIAFQVWFNDGHGIFQNTGQGLPSSNAQDVDLGDLDDDGDLDAFMVNTGSSDQGSGNTVWLNDGQGIFYDSGLRFGHSYSLDIALGDLDGDGDLDVFVANSFFSHSSVDKSNRVWLNTTNE